MKTMNKHNPVPNVYFYRQGDFGAIPGSPWVYWIPEGIKDIFKHNPSLGSLEPVKEGINTGDNFRFVRYWWEIYPLLGFDRESCFVPFCKGGFEGKYYDRIEECLLNDLSQMKYLEGSALRNINFSFREAIVFLSNSSTIFRARYVPAIARFCSTGGRAIFPKNINFKVLLGILNSKLTNYLLGLINPTISIKVGDINKFPIILKTSDRIINLVDKAINLRKELVTQDELCFDFVAPPDWPDGVEKVARRHEELAEIERQIDEEVYRLYEISEEDRRAIEEELGIRDSELGNEGAKSLSKEALAQKWVSYAVGIVLGRFKPGVAGALGRGRFSEEIAEKLRELTVPYGIAVLDKGHPHDLVAKVFEVLSIIYGEGQAAEIIRVATEKEGDPIDLLRKYLSGPFFKEHIKLYRKRPVYWLLQSPKKKYGLYLFHEKLTADTLYRIRGEEYVAAKIKLLESEINELRKAKEGTEGRERRRLEKEIAELEDMLEDVKEFARRIDAILRRGYTPHIDDGVLINMAPLWELIPSWQAEPKKCWQALERGDYDWSHMAMDYWPERVKEKCKTNKSYAIAHGLVDENDLLEEKTAEKKRQAEENVGRHIFGNS